MQLVRALFGNAFVVVGLVALVITVSLTAVWQPPYYLQLLSTAAVAMVAAIAFFIPDTMTVIYCLAAVTLRHEVGQIAGLETGSAAKLAFLGLLALHVLYRGVRPIRNWPVIVVAGLLFITFLLSSRLPSLSLYQSGKTAMALIALFLPLYVKWPEAQAYFYLRLFTVLPSLCVAFGVLFWVTGDESIFFRETSGAYRLQGALIPPSLAMLGCVAVLDGLYLALFCNSRRDVWLLLVNLVIVVVTGTRMGMMCAVLAIILALVMVRPTAQNAGARRLLMQVLIPGMVAALLIYLPDLLLRQSGSADGFNDSGRSWIWDHFYSVYEGNRAFGRGLGASAIAAFYDTGVLEEYVFFELMPEVRAAHNVYLQLMVDTGLVGMTLFVGAVVAVYFEMARRVDRSTRQMLLVMFIILAVYSSTDNTMNDPQFTFFYWSLALILTLGELRLAEAPVAAVQTLRPAAAFQAVPTARAADWTPRSARRLRPLEP